MLWKKLKQAKKNLGLEEKLITSPENEHRIVEKEEVIIGQDYYEDNSDYDNGERPDLGEGILRVDDSSPNDLDVDLDVEDEEDSSDEEVEEEVRASMINLSEYAEALQTPTMEQKEESMDVLCSDPYKKEDTSGNTDSNVTKFLEKYADGNDVLQVLRKDLMALLSDMQWIIESDNINEQWALDFADALNEISTSI